MRISDWSSDVCSSDLRGTPVLGICNGFQVLTETGQLPGALMRNQRLDFVCRDAPLTVENAQSAFTSRYEAGETIMIPVAHHDGNYFADADRSEEHTSELQSLMRISYAVFCLKKKNKTTIDNQIYSHNK